MTASVVEHVTGDGGLPKVIVRARDGACAEVYLQGAHVTSWRPAPGDEERLFLSATSAFKEGVAIRGGIPVIFPQFASEGPLQKHGFARNHAWTFVSAQEEGDSVTATFRLEQSAATLAVWPYPFRLTLAVKIGGARLTATLTVENTGTRSFDFAAALHTYFRVDDAYKTEIVGLQNGRYRTTPADVHFDEAESIHVTGEIDRVYIGAPSHLTLREPGRQLSVERAKFADVVVWNPGAEKAAKLDDMEPGGDRHMLCIEAGAIQTLLEVRPGKSWWGSQTLIAFPREVAKTPEVAVNKDPVPLDAGNPADGLTDQLHQLEEFVARAEAEGDKLPPEALEMVDKLKEIIQALEGLTSSLDVRPEGITLDEVSSATKDEK